MKNLDVHLKNIDIYPPSPEYKKCPYRWMGDRCKDAHELFYVLDGSFVLNVDHHSYIVKKNQMALFPAGHRISYWSVPGNPPTVLRFGFRASCHGEDIFSFYGMADDNHVVTLPEAEVMACYQSMISHSLNSITPSSYAMRCGQMAILLSIYFYARISMETEKNEFQDVLQYMQDHIAEDISLDDLASVFHFNASYFVTKFGKNMGIPPMKYFSKIRVQHAAKLLTTTDMPLTAVASSIGFSNVYYFKSFFEKNMGVCPDKYKDIMTRPADLVQT
ncbi:MAG: AraC family transcriptional regulator [Clostridia bacterium]|nr:AraC family transcriptional regulator [Clostridia bacterium]